MFDEMIDIQKKIEAIFKQNQASNDILDNTNFIILTTLITIISLIPSILIGFTETNTYIKAMCLLLMPLGFFTLFYLHINPKAKKKLKDKGVNQNLKFFNHWADEKYFSYKITKFYRELISSHVLCGNISDIQILDEYSNFFKEESQMTKSFDFIKVFIFSASMIILPFWKLVPTYIIKIIPELSLNDAILLGLKIIPMFIAIIFINVFIKFLLQELIDSKKKKLKNISVELIKLKWNLEIKHSQTIDLKPLRSTIAHSSS